MAVKNDTNIIIIANDFFIQLNLNSFWKIYHFGNLLPYPSIYTSFSACKNIAKNNYWVSSQKTTGKLIWHEDCCPFQILDDFNFYWINFLNKMMNIQKINHFVHILLGEPHGL